MIRKFTPEKDTELAMLYKNHINQKNLASYFKVSRSAIRKRLLKLGILDPSRSNRVWNENMDAELIYQYQDLEKGVMRCSQHFDVSQSVITRALKRLGILDSSRQFKKLHKNSVERSSKRRKHLFKDSVKQEAFKLAEGKCTHCGKDLESWRLATYHHRKLVDSGGTGNLENCQVLCKSDAKHLDPTQRGCHIVYYAELHGNRKYAYELVDQGPKDIRSCSCGQPSQLVNSDFCFNCAKRTIEEGREQELNVGTLQLKDLIRRFGLPHKTKEERKFTTDQLVEDMKEAKSGRALARKYGCSEAAIRQRLKRAGLKWCHPGESNPN